MFKWVLKKAMGLAKDQIIDSIRDELTSNKQRSKLVEKINEAVNIPGLNEHEEERIINAIYQTAVSWAIQSLTRKFK